MPLSWNEIRDRALAFSREWAEETSEDAEAKSFWDGFFNIFGVTRRRLATFEQPVKQPDGHTGYIDLLWKGQILVEHKSRGKDLDRAFKQAADYFAGLKERDLPKYILVSDFARFRLYDLDEDKQHDFPLAELHKHIRLFGFMAGYQKHAVTPQDPVNIEAAERLGKLHDALAATGYAGHPLEVMLVRLLFCLFAEDTGIFEKRQFQDFLETRTAEDGSDLGVRLVELYYNLNQPEDARSSALDEAVKDFPYVNGRLFEEFLPPAAFTRAMREALLECCALDWSRISPAIFGSLFQSVMSPGKRRELGAHYTGEENILKLIGPLFLDELKAELDAARSNKDKLGALHEKLARLAFLDPACGCGNFLVIAYRELRKLELEILRRVYGNRDEKGTTGFLDVTRLARCDVDQFYGIELEEFPVRIAEVAMWLMDHQMNLALSEEFGRYFRRLPLKKAASIVHGNALRIDWKTVIAPEKLNYILGNPPFGGAMLINDEQRADIDLVFGDHKGAGVLDYVAAWYWKSAEVMTANPEIRTGLVSTNSITQGEQVGILWNDLLRRGFKIQFAHRTFQWNSEARGKAAVHCVIVGFAKETRSPSPREQRERGEGGATAPGEGRFMPRKKFIFDYETPKSDPHAIEAKNINPYLVDAPDVVIVNRGSPISDIPPMRFGSMPRDGGHLIFTDDEAKAFLKEEPGAKKWIRPYTGAQEYLNGERRWCLWLLDAEPKELRALPKVMERMEAVRRFRLASKAGTTRKFAETPGIFCQLAQPGTDYLLVPRVSSERRSYIPLGFMKREVIANDQVLTVEKASLYHFGVMLSVMHMAWVRYTCGRLESRYRYSKDIVYNNFPWPDPPDAKGRKAIEEKAQAVLDARAAHNGASLADLYDPLTMPPDLRKAHDALDKAVDALYGNKSFTSDAERVAFLFARYEQLTQAPLEKAAAKPKRAKARRA